MPTKRCPGCSSELFTEPYIINGQTLMFWVCPNGDWEEPVEDEAESSQELDKE